MLLQTYISILPLLTALSITPIASSNNANCGCPVTTFKFVFTLFSCWTRKCDVTLTRMCCLPFEAVYCYLCIFSRIRAFYAAAVEFEKEINILCFMLSLSFELQSCWGNISIFYRNLPTFRSHYFGLYETMDIKSEFPEKSF